MKRAAVLLLLFACLLAPLGGCADAKQKEVGAVTPHLISEAEYPKPVAYPDLVNFRDPETGNFNDERYMEAYDAWDEAHRAPRAQAREYAGDLSAFTVRTMKQLLSGGEENQVYSPLNVYMALSMLAELTGGGSRQQVLDLLGADSVESARARAAALWRANYYDDGVLTSVLASSLWLNQEIAFKKPTLDALAKTYYASSFQGEMGSREMNEALRSWLNEQTNGLLAQQTAGVELDGSTILALATTVYFRGQWSRLFSASDTEEGTFHGAGGDTTCRFMRQSSLQTYYWGDQFTAIQQGIDHSGGMWLILPNEGVSADALLTDGTILALSCSEDTWEESRMMEVHLSMPKFDVASDLDLAGGLKALGLTDVFDSTASDFSPMAEDTDQVYLSQVRHAARVTADEEGCTAAAYVMMDPASAGVPPPADEVNFVLDRPFLFLITGADGSPLFMGVVRDAGAGSFELAYDCAEYLS